MSWVKLIYAFDFSISVAKIQAPNTHLYSSAVFIEGSLEVKLPTIWTDEKAEVERVREEKRGRKKIREEKEAEDRRCRYAKR